MDGQTFRFVDQEDGDDVLVVVRPVPNGVALTLSKRRGGDVEAVIPRADLERLVSALLEPTAGV